MLSLVILAACLLLSAIPQGASAETSKSGSSAYDVVMADRVSQGVQPIADTPQVENAITASPVYHKTYAGFEFLTTDSELTFASYGNGMNATSVPSSLSFKKAIDLPNGAQITRIDLYVIDNDATYDITVNLTYCTPSSGVTQNHISTFTSSGASTSVQTISVTGSPIVTIDNSTSRYYFRYQPAIAGQNHVIVGAYVQYTLPVSYFEKVMIQ
jgi:hypothetical protein